MDFAALPPEINSGRMYAGPGSGPMVAAAAAWNSLAINLGSAASSYGSVISGLTSGSWLGPSSNLMAAAATPYVAWLNTTATQAEQASAQANAAADAYEAAFAATVPPPVIAANRSLLASLTATNFLGQNAPAIATTEAHYGEMWAQDATAMYGYAGTSATATAVTPFTTPAPTTNPAGLTGQATGTSTASSASAATSASTTLSGLASELGLTSSTSGLGGLLTLSAGGNSSALGAFLNSPLLASTGVNGFFAGGPVSPLAIIDAMIATSVFGSSDGLGPAAAAVPTPFIGEPGLIGASSLVSSGVPGAGAVSAGVGRASLVGALSVPQNWSATGATTSSATLTSHIAAKALPGTSLGAVPETAGCGPTGMPGIPMTGMTGTADHDFDELPEYGFRPTVMARPPAAG